MKLDIDQQEREGIIILAASGRLTVGEATSALRERLTQLAASGKNRVVLNLGGVDYIDSTGLGTLVICFTTLKKSGGGLKLLNLNQRNIELLVLTKLTTVFEVFDNETDAVNSFFPNRQTKRFDILEFLQQQQHKQEG